jgi:prolyl-tRNA editing enzyme YbaK/EbsC (Cys-tRNA(Pro) deacylase)
MKPLTSGLPENRRPNMSREKIPVTTALLALKKNSAIFVPRPYSYEDRGGTRVSARELGVDEHEVIKTLVMEDDDKSPLIVLMHGDREVSTKTLARLLGVKAISPCDPKPG